MFILVCYDVPDDKRRTRIGKVLEGFGGRAQKSVFECDLTPPQYATLKKKLDRLVNLEEDSLRYYRLCSNCVPQIEVTGVGPPVEKTQLSFIF